MSLRVECTVNSSIQELLMKVLGIKLGKPVWYEMTLVEMYKSIKEGEVVNSNNSALVSVESEFCFRCGVYRVSQRENMKGCTVCIETGRDSLSFEEIDFYKGCIKGIVDEKNITSLFYVAWGEYR